MNIFNEPAPMTTQMKDLHVLIETVHRNSLARDERLQALVNEQWLQITLLERRIAVLEAASRKTATTTVVQADQDMNFDEWLEK